MASPARRSIVDLPLARRPRRVTQTSYSDLTGHPYAGLMVDARAGSARRRRPDRRQQDRHLPPAGAGLHRSPGARPDRAAPESGDQREPRRPPRRRRRRWTRSPSRRTNSMPTSWASILALRAAYWGMRDRARADADIAHVEDLLWQIAVGAGAEAACSPPPTNLRRLAGAAHPALAAHAPQEVIDALLQRYNQAMQRYLRRWPTIRRRSSSSSRRRAIPMPRP